MPVTASEIGGPTRRWRASHSSTVLRNSGIASVRPGCERLSRLKRAIKSPSASRRHLLVQPGPTPGRPLAMVGGTRPPAGAGKSASRLPSNTASAPAPSVASSACPDGCCAAAAGCCGHPIDGFIRAPSQGGCNTSAAHHHSGLKGIFANPWPRAGQIPAPRLALCRKVSTHLISTRLQWRLYPPVPTTPLIHTMPADPAHSPDPRHPLGHNQSPPTPTGPP